MKPTIVTDDPVLSESFSSLRNSVVPPSPLKDEDFKEVIFWDVYVSGLCRASKESEEEARDFIYNNSLKYWELFEQRRGTRTRVDSWIEEIKRRAEMNKKGTCL